MTCDFYLLDIITWETTPWAVMRTKWKEGFTSQVNHLPNELNFHCSSVLLSNTFVQLDPFFTYLALLVILKWTCGNCLFEISVLLVELLKCLSTCFRASKTSGSLKIIVLVFPLRVVIFFNIIDILLSVSRTDETWPFTEQNTKLHFW